MANSIPKLFILAVVGIAISATVGHVYRQRQFNQSSKQATTILPKTPPNKIESFVITPKDDLSSWTTYINRIVPYTIRHPNHLQTITTYNGTTYFKDNQDTQITIFVTKNNNFDSEEFWLKSQIGTKINKVKQKDIIGMSWYVNPQEEPLLFFEKQPIQWIGFDKDNVYLISNEKASDHTVELMLSTIIFAAQTNLHEQLCENSGGTWIEQYRECNGVDKQGCRAIGGTFNECASACRHSPNNSVCTKQCVPVCSL